MDEFKIPTNHSEESENANKEGESFKTKLAFWVFGFVLYINYALIISAAQDILSATHLPTTVVLLAQILPNAVIATICPLFIVKIRFSIRIGIVFWTFFGGLLFASLAKRVQLKLMGVCFISVGMGLGEMSILSLTAFYQQITIGAYAAGTGFGYVCGPLYYTGMTTLACVSPHMTILGILILQPFVPLVYFLMDKKRDQSSVSMTTKHKDIQYTTLDRTADDEATERPLTLKDKLSVARSTSPYAIVLAVGLFSEYLTLQSVVTTLAFPDAPFGPRNHYVIYTLLLMIGELMARSYGLICSSIKPGIKPYTRHTWIFAVILTAILVFLAFAAWYRFLRDVWIVLVLMFLCGLCVGALAVNTYAVTGEDETVRTKTEFSRAFVQCGIGLGISAAAFLGLRTEILLKEHCLQVTSMPEYCLTRSEDGWNTTVSCFT